MKWLHALVYSLWYPALLGTFLFTAFSTNVTEDYSAIWPWVFGLFFSVQMVEGLPNADKYRGHDFAADVLEMAAVYLCFAALFPLTLKQVPFGSEWVGWRSLPVAAMLAFAIAPAFRIVFERKSLCSPHRGFYRGLTVLSAAAVLATMAWAFVGEWLECAALSVVIVALVIYLICFVFFNQWVASKCSTFRRPPDGFAG